MLTVLFLGGIVAAFVFSWRVGVSACACCLAGLFLCFLLAPFFHELGHVVFARFANMRIVCMKFFCVRLYEKAGKLRFSFAPLFAAEETQAVPKTSENMKKRMLLYTAGGLCFGGVYALSLIGLSLLTETSLKYAFLGALPYAAYLFLLNALPVYLSGGKTDALIFRGIKRGDAEEKAVLSVMEAYGLLSEGKTFSEMQEILFSVPVIREDTPVYASILDFRYRFFLEQDDFDGAAESIDRLASLSEYLTEEQTEEVAAELSYMHALAGDLSRSEDARMIAERYLSADDLAQNRINAAFYAAKGDYEKARLYKERAENSLYKEPLSGKRKSEKKLLDRIEANI